MLHLGVDLDYNNSVITALSGGFAFLDELSLCMIDYSQIGPWLNSLLLYDDEPVSWFFCKNKFLSWSCHPFFFDVADENHQFFLVKDRVIENLYKMCSDLFITSKCLRNFERSYLLAASRGLVDDAHISTYLDRFIPLKW